MPEYPGQSLYQIKVTLVGSISPPIWRRLIIPKTITLDRLHGVIQDAMGWSDGHLYHFRKGKAVYQEMSEEFIEDYGALLPNMEEVTGVPLTRLLCNEKQTINYLYDMGDGWQHKVLLEKASLPNQVLPHVPYCIGGKGTCPAENSGGIDGYYDKLEALEDETNPDREELREHLEENLAGRKYDVDAINQRLASPF